MNISAIYNRIISRLSLRNEEYISSVPTTFRGRSKEETFFPIFKNPDKSEIKELKKFGANVRFMIYKNDIFVFPSELLHINALRQLSSDIGLSKDLYDSDKALFGIAKINSSFKLKVIDTAAGITDEDDVQWIEKNYKFKDRYFE